MSLIGKEIYLRFLTDTDASAKLDLNLRNREFFDLYMTTRSADYYTLEYQRDTIKSGLASKDRDEGYFFGVFLKNEDKLIGIVSLTEVLRGQLQSCWLGYSLDREYNGRGYTTEAVRMVTSYAFEELKLHRIEAGVMPHNSGSIRVLEKVGFEREGFSKKNVFINGRWEDHLHFAILNPGDNSLSTERSEVAGNLPPVSHRVDFPPSAMNIRVLEAQDAQAYQNLRLRALQTSPEAFGSTYEREVEFSLDTVRARIALTEDKFVLGAFTGDGQLVGMVTFVRESGVKMFHKGNIFGMYVAPEMRGKGVGRLLLSQLLDRASAMNGLEQINLTVVSHNEYAKKLYQAFGFATYGVELRALKYQGSYFDEDLMTLRVHED